MNDKIILLIIGLLLFGIPGIVSGTINITPVNVSQNYIQWEWPTVTNMTGISIDGRVISNYDPYATSYILSNTNPGEIHQITIYSDTDTGTNTTSTSPEPSGDVPLGIWIYGIPAVLILGIARWARVAVLNVLCVIFGLFGIFQLLTVKVVMDSGLWTMSLVVYFLLIFIGFIAWAAQTGRWK
jgi:hypothetical protein